MKKYQIIYADPPWNYKVYSKKGLGRSAESHYPTMSIEDTKFHIGARPISHSPEQAICLSILLYPNKADGFIGKSPCLQN